MPINYVARFLYHYNKANPYQKENKEAVVKSW